MDESAPDNAFHRIVYLFVCSSKNNCPAEPIVIRQQLPQVNKFYPQEAPDYEVCTSSRKFFNTHDTERGKCVEIVKTLHVKFFPFGSLLPFGIVSVKACSRS